MKAQSYIIYSYSHSFRCINFRFVTAECNQTSRSTQLTDSQKNLQRRIAFLQAEHTLVEPDFAVLRLVVRLEARQLVLLEPAEGEYDVGAEIRLNVFRHEFADFRSVLRPVGVVTDDLCDERKPESSSLLIECVKFRCMYVYGVMCVMEVTASRTISDIQCSWKIKLSIFWQA